MNLAGALPPRVNLDTHLIGRRRAGLMPLFGTAIAKGQVAIGVGSRWRMR
jgi:hypothetical protein